LGRRLARELLLLQLQIGVLVAFLHPVGQWSGPILRWLLPLFPGVVGEMGTQSDASALLLAFDYRLSGSNIVAVGLLIPLAVPVVS